MERFGIKGIVILFLAACSGCATVPQATTAPTRPQGVAGLPGSYHRVEKGQTLWSISKMYAVDLDTLVSINHIADATSIEVGQLIFLPRQGRSQPAYSGSAENFIWPARGRVIATFGQTYNNMVNKGLNIQTDGSHDVVAARSGQVVFYSPEFEGFGKTIVIDHGDGFLTVYARNAQVYIKRGDQVQKGMAIAKAGNAGRDRTTYLHFEIRKGGAPQNPYFYLPRQ